MSRDAQRRSGTHFSRVLAVLMKRNGFVAETPFVLDRLPPRPPPSCRPTCHGIISGRCDAKSSPALGTRAVEITS